jgi:AP2 domain/HNH endonuclease
VDHINGDSLDNRRSNLRAGTRAQNNMNRAANRTRRGRPTTSLYKGVSWDRRRNKWTARIGYNYKSISLGYFDSPEDGARAYDSKAEELFGECAYQNFPSLRLAA